MAASKTRVLNRRQIATGPCRAAIRSQKAKQRVAMGEWENPSPLVRNETSAEERQEFLEKVGIGIRRRRKKEVEKGTWRNPALTPEARRKLSRPRKHNGVLRKAIEKLRKGSMADLTDEEARAYRKYRRELRVNRRDEANAKHRAWYHKRQAQMTPEENEKQRARWRKQNRKRQQRNGRSSNPPQRDPGFSRSRQRGLTEAVYRSIRARQAESGRATGVWERAGQTVIILLLKNCNTSLILMETKKPGNDKVMMSNPHSR